jgi:medium-chain acyl-[acyl-carrier-protein] hydrolase
MPPPVTDHWIVADARPGHRTARLILLPYAGGGANIYRLWPSMMPPDVDVRAVQLPGRERRIFEPPMTRMEPLLDALVLALRPLLGDLPFALFGHSMGACIAHALTLRLSDLGLPQPFLLIVSGREAPHWPRRPSVHTLPEPEFLEALRRLNGTPPEVLESRELLDLVLPMLRADFGLVAEYRPEPRLLTCPVVVLGGESDIETTPEGLAAWSACTTAPTRVAMLPGGHFFPDTARAAVVETVTAALRQHTRKG